MFLIDKSYWKVRYTKNIGMGVFAKKPIKAGTVIGDYVGKLIHIKDIDFEKEKKNMYLMNYNDEVGIYPDLKKPGVHLINNSCCPNCFIYKYKDHTLVFALKNIQKGEELTISYLLPPKIMCINCTHICYCESKNCTGSMHLIEEKYKIWQKVQNKQENKINNKEVKNAGTLKPLSKYPKYLPKKDINEIKNLGII